MNPCCQSFQCFGCTCSPFTNAFYPPPNFPTCQWSLYFQYIIEINLQLFHLSIPESIHRFTVESNLTICSNNAILVGFLYWWFWIPYHIPMLVIYCSLWHEVLMEERKLWQICHQKLWWSPTYLLSLYISWDISLDDKIWQTTSDVPSLSRFSSTKNFFTLYMVNGVYFIGQC